MTVLLTGGAGYIGSITNTVLQNHGVSTIIFDNGINGHRDAVGDTQIVYGDITKPKDLEALFTRYQFDSVIHFAALALVSESMEKPAKYYEVNILGGINLLEAMKRHGCKTIVFSSSCSVYGIPPTLPVTEETPIKPMSVYAESKMMFEEVLMRYGSLFGFKYGILRYFNACGALLDGSLGEDHTPESHIIPAAIQAALKNKIFELYGTDYQTPDGTCIRDYIHVLDLADAHERSLKYLETNSSFICNLGSNKGYSNREILRAIEKETGKKIAVSLHAKRIGDPDAITTRYDKAKSLLGWEPKYSALETIIQSAVRWHTTHPDGFDSVKVGRGG